MTSSFYNFVLGLQAQFEPDKPLQEGYALLSNGRVRNNVVEPVRSPVEDTSLPAGNYQGIYGVGSYLIVFIDGELWYRDVTTTNAFVRAAMPSALDADVPYIYLEQIPATTVPYERAGAVAVTSFNNNRVTTHPAGLVIMDGVNQPQFVVPLADGSLGVRVISTYAEYNLNNREYVPVGICPKMIGEKLFMVGKDSTGRYTQIFQSVSGRPLDFVIAIEPDGTKAGDASAMAHSVGLDEITAIMPTQAEDAGLAFTATGTFLVSVDYSNLLLFGEPRLRNTTLFPVGVLNPFSFASRNGEMAFIHRHGISAFNTVLQLRNESNNEPLSRSVQRLLRGKVQSAPAAINDDDYMYLAVDTVHGPGVLVYDNVLGQYVALDIYRNVGQIRMFAKTTEPDGTRLWFITNSGLFEHEGSDEYETARMYIGDWFGPQANSQYTPTQCSLIFTSVNEDTEIAVTLYQDRREVVKHTTVLKGVEISDLPSQPMPGPIVTGPRNVPYIFKPAKTGGSWSFGYMIEWRGAASLAGATVDYTIESGSNTIVSVANANYRPNANSKQTFFFLADSAPNDNIERIIGSGIVIGGGDHLYNNGTISDYINAFDGRWTAGPQFFMAPGNHDLDTDNGKVFFDRFNGQRYYSKRFGEVEFFFLNAGYSTATVALDAITRAAGAPDKEPDGNTMTSVQAQWLRRVLRASDARFKFVVVHAPPYSNEVGYYPGYDVLRWPFRTWGATAVLSGHAHNYERLTVDGLPYIVCGTGGHSLRGFTNTVHVPYEARQSDSFGVLELTTNGFSCNTRFIKEDGSSFDRHIITV